MTVSKTLKTITILLGLLGLFNSSVIIVPMGCSPADVAGASYTYNTEYTISDTNGQISIGDKLTIGQRHSHSFWRIANSAQSETVFTSVEKMANSNVSGNTLRLDISDNSGLIKQNWTMNLGGPISDIKAYKSFISTIVNVTGEDKIRTIIIDTSKTATYAEILAAEDAISIAHSMTSYDSIKVLQKGDIMSFFISNAIHYYLVKVDNNKHAIVKNVGGKLDTIIGEILLPSTNPAEQDLRCYQTVALPNCFDLKSKTFFTPRTAAGKYPPFAIQEIATTFVTSLWRVLSWSVLSIHDASGAGSLRVKVYQDVPSSIVDPTLLTGTLSAIGTVGLEHVAVVSSGYNHQIEYHPNIALRFMFKDANYNNLIVATIASGDLFGAIATSTVHSWNADQNQIFILFSDKIVTGAVNYAGIPVGESKITDGSGKLAFDVDETRFTLSTIVDLSNSILTEITALNNVLSDLESGCICLHKRAALFKCFANAFCLAAVDYENITCTVY